jgi:hypothetical protein
MRMPVRSLPDRPDLDQYKKQAKELVKAHAAGDAAALARVREHHPRLSHLDDDALRRARFALADAQWLIAREHGIESWPRFVAAIAAHVAAHAEAPPAPEPWRLAEDAVVRGDADALAAVLRDHGDELRRGVPSTWWGGLAPSYPESDARDIIVREHFFENWDAFAAHAARRRDPASSTARFEAAVDAIVSGDLTTLARLLREDPSLVHARSGRTHHAMLLHYVGSNGVEAFRQRTPKNIVAITTALLDAGADVNAICDIYGGGAETLGLAATSIHPVTAGVLDELLACLLARGAAVGEARGGAAWSRLINGCHANGRPAGAQFLAARAEEAAAELDLEAAAGVGRLDLVRRFFSGDGTLTGATADQARDGFTWACEYGWTDVVAFLLQRGQDVNARLPKHCHQTGLHWAAWGGHTETVRVLLAAGAGVDIHDAEFDGTALGWALHAWAGGGPSPADDRYVTVAQQLRAAGATLDRAWLDDSRRLPSFEQALSRSPAMRAALGLEEP